MRDDGFAAFFRVAYPRVVGQLRLLTGDLATAEDVAQEAFVRAASRWGQLARYQHPEAWVRKTAFRLAVDGLRRARRHRGALARLAVASERAAPLDAEDREVVAALHRLPLAQREALVLHHCLDLPRRGGRGPDRGERRYGQVAAGPRPRPAGRDARRRGARGGTPCP
jgi:RNA polymerase sigma-70 factor (ECF subfamily)